MNEQRRPSREALLAQYRELNDHDEALRAPRQIPHAQLQVLDAAFLGYPERVAELVSSFVHDGIAEVRSV